MKPPKQKGDNSLPFYKNKKKLITLSIALFFMVIMATSILELYVRNGSEDEIYDYNGLKFANTGNGWLAYRQDGRPIYILSNPKDLENITISPINIATLNYAQKAYLSYNPKERNKIALSEFFREMKISPRIVNACYEDNEQCANLPIKTCEDTTTSVAVILLRESNETSVTFINNCLSIQGKELTKVMDKLILVTQA